jgi:hypothetical protein
MTGGHPELEPIGGSGDFALFESTGAASGDYTQMGWEVDESRRKSRLVQDSEGNLLGIGQRIE